VVQVLIKEHLLNPVLCPSVDFSKTLLEVAALTSIQVFESVIDCINADSLEGVPIITLLLNLYDQSIKHGNS